MSYWCGNCLTHWAPYHCDNGACPKCGGGTIPRQEPVDEDAGNLHREILLDRQKAERSAHAHREFDLYCAKRDAARLAAAQDTDEIDTNAVQRAVDEAA